MIKKNLQWLLSVSSPDRFCHNWTFSGAWGTLPVTAIYVQHNQPSLVFHPSIRNKPHYEQQAIASLTRNDERRKSNQASFSVIGS